MKEQGDLLWHDNLTHCSCQVGWRETHLWLMILHKKKIYCKDTKNELKGYHNKIVWLHFVLMQDSWPQLKSDSISWRKDTAEFSQFTDSVACREYTLSRDESSSEPKGWIRGNTKIGPVLEVTTCCLQGKYGVDQNWVYDKDNFHSWVRISHGLNKLVTNLNNKDQDDNEQETIRNADRRICFKIECKWFCKPIKSQSKTTKTYFCQLIHKNYTYWGKNSDWHWTTRIFALWLFSVKETNPSSSWETTSRRWWSDWILVNKRWSSEPFCVFSTLVWWKVEEQHGKRRRKQEKIPALYWCFRRNSLPPSSSRSFRAQSCRSFITRQCLDSRRFLQVHLSRWMCNQFTFHHQFRIETGKSKFEQTTDSILSACGSHGQRTQGSWHDRLGRSTASCTVHA